MPRKILLLASFSSAGRGSAGTYSTTGRIRNIANTGSGALIAWYTMRSSAHALSMRGRTATIFHAAGSPNIALSNCGDAGSRRPLPWLCANADRKPSNSAALSSLPVSWARLSGANCGVNPSAATSSIRSSGHARLTSSRRRGWRIISSVSITGLWGAATGSTCGCGVTSIVHVTCWVCARSGWLTSSTNSPRGRSSLVGRQVTVCVIGSNRADAGSFVIIVRVTSRS